MRARLRSPRRPPGGPEPAATGRAPPRHPRSAPPRRSRAPGSGRLFRTADRSRVAALVDEFDVLVRVVVVTLLERQRRLERVGRHRRPVGRAVEATGEARSPTSRPRRAGSGRRAGRGRDHRGAESPTGRRRWSTALSSSPRRDRSSWWSPAPSERRPRRSGRPGGGDRLAVLYPLAVRSHEVGDLRLVGGRSVSTMSVGSGTKTSAMASAGRCRSCAAPGSR